MYTCVCGDVCVGDVWMIFKGGRGGLDAGFLDFGKYTDLSPIQSLSASDIGLTLFNTEDNNFQHFL